MPERRLSVDAVMKMAHATAQQHLSMPLQEQLMSPKMVDAIEQVWELVKGRLGSPETAELDDLIKSIVETARSQ
jgi:predicted glycosyltransferase